MSWIREDINNPTVGSSTYPVAPSAMQPLTPFLRQGLLDQLDPRLLELRPRYQSDPILPYYNYNEPTYTRPPPLVLPVIPVAEEERIDVGVEETEPYMLTAHNTTHELLPLQMQLRHKVNQQLQEYHAQLLRSHENSSVKSPANFHYYVRDNAAPIMDKIGMPTYAYVQQTLISEEKQRSFTTKLELKNAYQVQNVQEKGLQTDLPERSQYTMNQPKNRIQVQLPQRAAPNPVDVVSSYNIAPPQPPTVAIQYGMYQGYDEPINLSMPKKGGLINPPPAHNNPANPVACK